jgi:hypothetical protein
MSQLGNININEGILFEDNGHFLKWYDTIRSLEKENEVRKEVSDDRTIFYWGKHQILNGLELELFSFYWKYRLEDINKRFNSIEFKVVGDKISGQYFDLIKKHVESVFGKGLENIMSESDKSIEWKIDGVRLYLLLFEQFVYKLNFKISKT